jgi:hypothetical protein
VRIELPKTSSADLLFVIDDSPSMRDKQVNLADNFPQFITVLRQIEGGLPNVHIGVVTSDVGTKGAEDAAPGQGIGTLGQGGCSGTGKSGNLQLFGAPVSGGPFISDIAGANPGERVTNYTGALDTVFADMAKGAGAGGCGFEQHLEAMKLALQPSNAANLGFLRPDAYLAVIFIADEDDCSMSHSTLLGNDSALGPQQSFRCTRFGVLCDQNGATPDAMNQVGPKSQCHPNDGSAYLTKVAEYAKFLKGLKSDPSKVVVAGVMGTPDPFNVELRAIPPSTTRNPALAHSCTYVGGDGKTEVADPPTRLKFFLDQFPSRSTFVSICQRDLSGGLVQIADLLKTVIGNPCIEGKLADLDPSTPQLDPDCSVSQLAPLTEEKILPRCTPEDASATNKPCWHLVSADPAKCTKFDHLELKIERTAEDEASLANDTRIRANCVTVPPES